MGILLVLNSHMAFYERSEQSKGLKEVQGIWRAAAKANYTCQLSSYCWNSLFVALQVPGEESRGG